MPAGLTTAERLRLIGWSAALRGGAMSVDDALLQLNAKRYEQAFEGRSPIDGAVSRAVLFAFLNPYQAYAARGRR